MEKSSQDKEPDVALTIRELVAYHTAIPVFVCLIATILSIPFLVYFSVAPLPVILLSSYTVLLAGCLWGFFFAEHVVSQWNYKEWKKQGRPISNRN